MAQYSRCDICKERNIDVKVIGENRKRWLSKKKDEKRVWKPEVLVCPICKSNDDAIQLYRDRRRGEFE